MQEMPTRRGRRAAQRSPQTPEAQVRDRRWRGRPPQGRADVLEAERLDPEEGAKPETLVSRIGAKEEDVHRRPVERIVNSALSQENPW